MRTLFYGSFESVLFKHCRAKFSVKYPHKTSDRFTCVLLATGIDYGIDEAHEELLDDMDSSVASRYRKGKSPIKQSVVNCFFEGRARERVIQNLSSEVVPWVSVESIPNLIKDLCEIIEKDTTISVPTKSVFYQKATKERLSEFLADLLIYVVPIDPREDVSGFPQFIGNLPPRNEFFVERKDLMDELYSNFQALTRVQILHGTGGMGKSQLAIHYAYTSATTYDFVWLINGTSPLKIIEGYSLFLKSRGIMVDDKEADLIILTAIDYFNNHKNWLLIFDNCDYFQDKDFSFLQNSLPNNTDAGHILITSRTIQRLQKAKTIEVGIMSPEAAVRFVETRIGKEDQQIPELCQTLGYYPLALECAAAYIANTPGYTSRKYLKLLDEYGIDLLCLMEGVEQYDKTIHSVLFITLQQLREHGKNDIQKYSVYEFLSYASLLDSDDIDINLFSNLQYVDIQFRRGAPETAMDRAGIGEVCSDELMRNELVSTLVQYSLLKPMNKKGNGFYFHPLLQTVILNRFESHEEMFLLAMSLWRIYAEDWLFMDNTYRLHHLCTLSEHIIYNLPYYEAIASESLITKWQIIHTVIVGILYIISIKAKDVKVESKELAAINQEIAAFWEELEDQLESKSITEEPELHILTLSAYTESLYLFHKLKSPLITSCLSKTIGLAIDLLKQELTQDCSRMLYCRLRSLKTGLILIIQDGLYCEDTNLTIPRLEEYTDLICKRVEQGKDLMAADDFAEFKDTVKAWSVHDIDMLPDSVKDIINLRVKYDVLPPNEKYGNNGIMKLTTEPNPPKFISRTEAMSRRGSST